MHLIPPFLPSPPPPHLIHLMHLTPPLLPSPPLPLPPSTPCTPQEANAKLKAEQKAAAKQLAAAERSAAALERAVEAGDKKQEVLGREAAALRDKLAKVEGERAAGQEQVRQGGRWEREEGGREGGRQGRGAAWRGRLNKVERGAECAAGQRQVRGRRGAGTRSGRGRAPCSTGATDPSLGSTEHTCFGAVHGALPTMQYVQT
jgi:hypothetical protein